MQKQLYESLSHLPLGEIRFFESIGSTNDYALQWVDETPADASLVLADEQSAGRGRMGRKWLTQPGSALAMSLILRPTQDERTHPSRMTGLLAVSLTESLRKRGISPQIKWPNDVLVGGRKIAGILVETVWTGSSLDALVLGMGVNVLRGSLPPPEELLFPATSLEDVLNQPLDRTELLSDILTSLFTWRTKLGTPAFLNAWEESMAYRGQQVRVWRGNDQPTYGILDGLEPDGALRLLDENGKSVIVRFGEVHLRPVA